MLNANEDLDEGITSFVAVFGDHDGSWSGEVDLECDTDSVADCDGTGDDLDGTWKTPVTLTAGDTVSAPGDEEIHFNFKATMDSGNVYEWRALNEGTGIHVNTLPVLSDDAAVTGDNMPYSVRTITITYTDEDGHTGDLSATVCEDSDPTSCEASFSLSKESGDETTGAVYGCSVKAGAVNYDSTTGEGSADCNNAGNDCVECKEGETCEAGEITGGGADGGAIELTTDADVDLLTLKLCDSTGSSIDDIDDLGQNYGLVHSLGLVYQRDGLDAGRDAVTYCQDQEFVTTIARDASASTSVTTLIAPSLQRSILVHGINWVACPSTLLACQGSDDCYKLQIDLSAREKNADSDSWANATLSDSFQHQGGANTDLMEVVHSLSPASPGNLISLVGKCGIVDDCSLSATCLLYTSPSPRDS